jgi:hypothetical protein
VPFFNLDLVGYSHEILHMELCGARLLSLHQTDEVGLSFYVLNLKHCSNSRSLQCVTMYNVLF